MHPWFGFRPCRWSCIWRRSLGLRRSTIKVISSRMLRSLYAALLMWPLGSSWQCRKGSNSLRSEMTSAGSELRNPDLDHPGTKTYLGSAPEEKLVLLPAHWVVGNPTLPWSSSAVLPTEPSLTAANKDARSYKIRPTPFPYSCSPFEHLNREVVPNTVWIEVGNIERLGLQSYLGLGRAGSQAVDWRSNLLHTRALAWRLGRSSSLFPVFRIVKFLLQIALATRPSPEGRRVV